MSYLHLDAATLTNFLRVLGIPLGVTQRPDGRVFIAPTKTETFLARILTFVGLTTGEVTANAYQHEIEVSIHSLVLRQKLKASELPAGLSVDDDCRLRIDLRGFDAPPKLRELLNHITLTRGSIPGENGAAATVYFHCGEAEG